MNPHLNGGSFRYMDGCLWCENVKLKTVKESIERKLGWSGPIFVYSKEQLSNNIKSYLGALLEYNLNFGLGYALKANSNYHLLKIIQQFDCFSVTVSGYEIEMALLAGFRADRIIFNGNGKQNWEIEKAIQNGCLLNIDSIFDVNSISLVAKKLNSKCRILVRINPDLDAKVHPHNCTALAHSKFGIELKQFDAVVNKILENNESLILVGIHSHIGSTVDDVSLYEDVCRVLLEIAHKLRDLGFAELKFINIGGGLGIDYTKQDSTFPLAKDLIKKISHLFHHEDFMLLLEPGRSIIGNTSVLIADVVGIKQNGNINFVVTNASMTEVIRPSLYAAYHHISHLDLISCDENKGQLCHIVGPVCESGDFLGKDRLLQPPPTTGSQLVVWDVGAYCYAMSSNYNLRARPPEILVNNDVWTVIRRPETFLDLCKAFDMP